MSKRALNNDDNSKGKKLKINHWSRGLIEAAKDPKIIKHEDSYTYVILDKYPKAKYHYLVVSKQNIPSIRHVTKSDIDLLKHMEKVAKGIKEDLLASNPDYNFKIGYHAQPSMARLHLHLISDDMNSPHLKNKKHWNSFTTNFFISSENIIESLVEKEVVSLPSEKECKTFLTKDLRCNKCCYVPKNLSYLKKHILEHLGK